MRAYKQFYMIFVLMRACLWNVSSSFARDAHTDIPADPIMKDGGVATRGIMISTREVLYVVGDNATEQNDFLRTQANGISSLPVFHRDTDYNWKGIKGERARFLRLLLFPNHTFG